MKIIDLLNKIANGEEIPKKIIWNKLVYELKDGIYFDYCGETLIGSLNFDGTNLNEEVEIIEEDKKIKKLNGLYTLDGNESAMPTTLQDFNNRDILKKINELIDAVNSMNKGGNNA